MNLLKNKISILICTIILLPSLGVAQKDSSFFDFSAYIVLDSIMITAERSGFSVDEFIEIIQNDRSTQEAFQNLRKLSYRYSNELIFSNNLKKVKASYQSVNIQHLEQKCQWMEILEEDYQGKFYRKNGNPRYYTAKLYDRVFYVGLKPCVERTANKQKTNKNKSQKIIESRIAELKKLIYTPGKKADIPLIGNKTAIFTEKMISNYDLSLISSQSASGAKGYLFTAKVKPSINMADPNSTVVKYLEVFVEKGSMQVLTRNYKLQYNAGIYDFDIVMKVALTKDQGMYFPHEIEYEGYWNIVGQPKEDCKFQFRLIDFL